MMMITETAKRIKKANDDGFKQGVAYMIGLVASCGFHVSPDDLFNEPGFTFDDLKDAGADSYDLRQIARGYQSSLRRFRRKQQEHT
jgi:hypothetical protein